MFQLLRTFVSVYETRNFTHTAEELFLSQPTVSFQIKKLEEQLKIQLFHRSGKQEILPTKEAEFLYSRVLQILEEWDDAALRLRKKENFRERCEIGCSHTCAVYFVPKVMPYLIRQFPNVDFSIAMMNSEEVVHQMEQNKVDIGFIEKPSRHESLHQESVYQDELVLTGEPDSPYWLLRENESGLRFYNDVYLEKNNLNPHIIHVNNNEAIIALIKSGVGQTILSKLAVTAEMPWRPLADGNTRDFYFLSHRVVFRATMTEINDYLREIIPTINVTKDGE